MTIRITVKNLGPAGTQASLTDTLPSASPFVSLVASQGTCDLPPVGSTGTVTCALGTLAPGATATVTVTIKPTIKKGTGRVMNGSAPSGGRQPWETAGK